MSTAVIPPCLCPQCGAMLDRVTDPIGNDKARPDDFTVCLDCTAVLRFNPDMSVRLTNQEDLQKLPPEVLKKLAAIRIATACTNKMFDYKPPARTKQ